MKGRFSRETGSYNPSPYNFSKIGYYSKTSLFVYYVVACPKIQFQCIIVGDTKFLSLVRLGAVAFLLKRSIRIVSFSY